MTSALTVEKPSILLQQFDHNSYLHFRTRCKSRVYSQSIHAVRRVEHSFRQCWVGVDGPHQIFDGGFEFHRSHSLSDQFGRLWSDDVHSQNFSVLRVRDHFDESLMLANDGCARIRCEWKLANFDVVTLLPRLSLSQADTADLGMTKGHVRNL